MAWVINPKGERRQVQNLGWILRHWQEVEVLRWLSMPCRRDDDGVFSAVLRDGTEYMTDYADYTVFLEFVDRPVFRGVAINIDGKLYTVGSPQFRALRPAYMASLTRQTA